MKGIDKVYLYRTREVMVVHSSDSTKGFFTSTSAFRKSSVFLVATVSWFRNAVAAIKLSLTGIARPVFFNRARSLAHCAAVAVSKSKTRSRSTPLVTPFFEPLPTTSFRQDEDAVFQLAQHDGIDNKLGFVVPQPIDHRLIRSGFGGLTQNVCIDKVGHNVSVDSDSMG